VSHLFTEEMIESWTLVAADWKLLATVWGDEARLQSVAEVYEIEDRFPAMPRKYRPRVDYVVGLVKVDPALFDKYAWRGSTIEYHRSQIRKAFALARPPRTTSNAGRCGWPAEVCPVETRRDRLAAALPQ